MIETERKNTTYDLFLSYASEDRNLVRKIVSRLQACGISVWYDVIELNYANSAPDHSRIAVDLQQALNSCTQFWLVVGPEYTSKTWTKFEALTAAARVLAGLASFGVMFHSVAKTDAKSVAAELHLAVQEENLYEVSSEEGILQATQYLEGCYSTRVLLTAMVRFNGPVDVTIFPDFSQIWVFPNGSFLDADSQAKKPRAFDFTGREITSLNVSGIFDTMFGPTLKEKGSVPVNSGGKVQRQRIELEGEVILGFMNHPGQEIYTDSEIQNGTIQNLAYPLVFVPTIAHGPVTIGYVTDKPPEIAETCLSVSGCPRDSWARINLKPQQNSFSITLRGDRE